MRKHSEASRTHSETFGKIQKPLVHIPKHLVNIILALNQIAQSKQVVLPLHPRTKKILETGDYDTTHLTIIDPVGYLNMLWLIKHCSLVMTDSGGLQKEAYFFEKQCITLRNETEWVELIESGVNTLVGADQSKIMTAYSSQACVNTESLKLDLYGGGKASERIIMEIINATAV